MTSASRFEQIHEGDVGSLDRAISADDVAAFVRLTGDDNPVHWDSAYAATTTMGRPVVHGMLTASFISTLIGTVLPGPGALWLSQRFDFRAPVYVDDRIRAKVRVRHRSPATKVLVLDVTVLNQDGKVVLEGEAMVKVL